MVIDTLIGLAVLVPVASAVILLIYLDAKCIVGTLLVVFLLISYALGGAIRELL